MAGTCNDTRSGKEFFADNTSQIPDLMYHQSNDWRYIDGTTSLLTTTQATLVVEEERKCLKADTFV